MSGDYAVLLGAPAIVIAVDRRASCTLDVTSEGGWRFRSQPPMWNAELSLDAIRNSKSEDLLAYALRCLNASFDLPEHADLSMDTRGLYSFGKKLGLGSSAASLVALYAAASELAGTSHSMEGALALHEQFRTGGSGIDVAASYCGGVICFETGKVKPLKMPASLNFRVFYVGVSTNTEGRVLSFQNWIKTQPASSVEQFREASTRVVQSVQSSDSFLDALRYFIEVQELIDNASGLGIWGPQHRAMKAVANREGVLYKPSGAGGGDIGIAFSTSIEGLDRLSQQVERMGGVEINTAIDYDGVTVGSAY